jgi:hypothetical protein
MRIVVSLSNTKQSILMQDSLIEVLSERELFLFKNMLSLSLHKKRMVSQIWSVIREVVGWQPRSVGCQLLISKCPGNWKVNLA